MNKNTIGTYLAKMDERKVIWLDLKMELAEFAPQLLEAEQALREGKPRKLKQLASSIEFLRVVKMFFGALEANDILLTEYYGGIIREQYTDKPKVSLEHSSDGKTFPGVVILPPVDKGSDDVVD